MNLDRHDMYDFFTSSRTEQAYVCPFQESRTGEVKMNPSQEFKTGEKGTDAL